MTDTFPNLYQTIESAEHPVILLIVSGGCDKVRNQFEEDFEKRLQERAEDLIYYSSCIPEQNMGFPRYATPMAYYFIPKNKDPVFWRGHDAIARIPEDIPVLCKMAGGMSEQEARFTPKERENISKIDEMLETENISKFPPLFQQFRNLAKETWNTGKRASMGLPILLSAEDAYARFQTCHGCDQFEKESSRCKACGCNMKMKTHLASATCPLSKWPVHK